MMYQITGSLNAAMMMLGLLGLWLQLKMIWQRKADPTIDSSTDLLSINQFFAAFLAYWSFFIHGYAMAPLNHFIIWPRLLAALLVIVILFEIFRDRSNRRSLATFILCSLALLAGITGLLIDRSLLALDPQASAIMIVAVTLFLGQGYYHQIRVILKNGETGAIALRMNQFIALKDLSTITFALTMKLENSWPLILLASVSGSTKLVIMYLFRWVRLGKTSGPPVS